MSKHKKEHKDPVFSKQIFCKTDTNANANVIADAEILKKKFPNGPLILLEIGHLDRPISFPHYNYCENEREALLWI